MQDPELSVATVKEITEAEAGEGESSEPVVIGKATDPAAAAAVPHGRGGIVLAAGARANRERPGSLCSDLRTR